MQMMLKHIFWPIIDCFSVYASGVRRIQGVVSRRIGWRGHVTKMRSHVIRSAISETPPPLLYANFTALSFIEPELGLLPIEVLHCGNRKLRVFSEK